MTSVGTSGGRTFAVTSAGLAQISADIAKLLDTDSNNFVTRARNADMIVGWGNRPSGQKARRLAEEHHKQLVLLEDGFLKGFSSQLNEPSHSFVVDFKGMYFDTAYPSTFADRLDQPLEVSEAKRARRLIDFMRSNRITKFNNSPTLSPSAAGIPPDRPYVLLVDQVAGDASIAGAGVGMDVFDRMISAAKAMANSHTVVIRAHPAQRKSSPLIIAARKAGMDFCLSLPANPWMLIEHADMVMTVSSHLGFEALMAGRPVHCFGRTWYAGWGLTEDRFVSPVQGGKKTVEHLFHALYCDYSVWLDVHSRERIDAETAMEQALMIRNQRMRLHGPIHTAGFSPWKRKATEPFLVTAAGRARHHFFARTAEIAANKSGGSVAAWGNKPGCLQIEDGFIRSRGLGANLAFPASLCVDQRNPYYDARAASELEVRLQEGGFSSEILQRASELRRKIVQAEVTKYNLTGDVSFPAVQDGALRILVPGQVEADNSIRFGNAGVKTNSELVQAVRQLFPNAFIVYKVHPDVAAGLRSGGQQPVDQDHFATTGSISKWLDWSERVETLTSLTGFEALLRGKPVGVHGWPFYAGWGLTEDRHLLARRSRKRTLDELIAAVLIEYPFYIHPESRIPCTVEDIVGLLSATQSNNAPVPQDFVTRGINRIAIAIRDLRLKFDQ